MQDYSFGTRGQVHEAPEVDLTRELEALGIKLGEPVAGTEVPALPRNEEACRDFPIDLATQSSPV